MDLAYDLIQESALSPDETAENGETKPEPSTLNTDFREAYKAISSSPWGARLGGFFGNVVKQVSFVPATANSYPDRYQSENVYREAQQELSAVGEEATKGFTSLQSSILNRTRALSLNQKAPATSAEDVGEGPSGSQDATTEKTIQESEGVLARLRSEAAKRLKEIEKAEDAADEALLKFGTNIRNFLRDAVTIAPPSEGSKEGSTVLFESKDAQGKRVIHTTRFDAQLHVIHSSLKSFTNDPISEEYAPWAKGFNVESKTDDISTDLEKYRELRTAMEKLVPDQVSYGDFWRRYYFLRHSIETAEARRRDLLKGMLTTIFNLAYHTNKLPTGAAAAEEEVGWDEESDDEASTKADAATNAGSRRPVSVESSTTIHPPPHQNAGQTYLKVSESRKSHDEKSQADSDASYDVVGATSGAPSHAPGSPKDSRKGDDSEEEDWE